MIIYFVDKIHSSTLYSLGKTVAKVVKQNSSTCRQKLIIYFVHEKPSYITLPLCLLIPIHPDRLLCPSGRLRTHSPLHALCPLCAPHPLRPLCLFTPLFHSSPLFLSSPSSHSSPLSHLSPFSPLFTLQRRLNSLNVQIENKCNKAVCMYRCSISI